LETPSRGSSGAKVVQAYPTRFGSFAAMPLPDVDATLKGFAYAYDRIHANGIGFMTSFGGTWLKFIARL
jgi:6-methylsalicylate decarboxylase